MLAGQTAQRQKVTHEIYSILPIAKQEFLQYFDRWSEFIMVFQKSYVFIT
jgi:hypothetical protein